MVATAKPRANLLKPFKVSPQKHESDDLQCAANSSACSSVKTLLYLPRCLMSHLYTNKIYIRRIRSEQVCKKKLYLLSQNVVTDENIYILKLFSESNLAHS
jgi:hypothetical protein